MENELPRDQIVVSEKVAILLKQDQVAAIGLAIREHGTTLGVFDVNGIKLSPMYSPLIGIERFQSSLATSRNNGWSIGYFGVPRFG